MKETRLGQTPVGANHPPFIIAEAGINHNGNLDTALRMVTAAKESGADAIKFQTFRADEFVGDPAQTYTYTSQGTSVTESMLAMFRRYEFDRSSWIAIKRKCDETGIVFLSTPQNLSDLEVLIEIGISAIKVGSDDFTNYPLLRSFAGKNLPIIVSCGMSDLSEVYQALDVIGSLDGYPTVLMLCTSQYPTPPGDVNLLKLRTLAGAFPGIPLGFSDHTQGALASSLALALGARVFEKHFTLDRSLPGPDHWFSEDRDGLREWVASIRTSAVMLGSPLVKPTEQELNMRSLARRSITAIADIAEGDTLSLENIGLRRPGNGLPPRLFDTVIGRKSARNIPKNTLLKWGDFL